MKAARHDYSTGSIRGHCGCRTRPGRRAFTLIELLVVIAVIAVLLAMLMPALSGAKESVRRVVCLSQLRQIYLVAGVYAGDADGYLPGGAHVDRIGAWNRNQGDAGSRYNPGVEAFWTFGYLTDRRMMTCPSRTDHPTGMTPETYVGRKYWLYGYASYAWCGSSIFTFRRDNPYSEGGVYWGRLEKFDPWHSLVLDMVVDERDYAYGWCWLVQTNHLRGNIPQMPAGGNNICAGGSGAWLPFTWPTANTDWNRPWGREYYPKGSSSINRNASYFWNAPGGEVPAGPRRGTATM